MAVGAINGQSTKLNDYQDFSIQCFDSIDEFVAYSELAKSKGNQQLFTFLDRERDDIDVVLQNSRNNKYGLKGTDKAPLSYQDALNRKTFVYKDEYEKAKEIAKKLLDKNLEKSSLAEAMKSKMIFTERELGEFIYERASMSIKPNLFYYSEIHKIEIDEKEIDSVVENGRDVYTYKKDGTKIIICLKVTVPPDKEGGKETYEYYEASKTTDADLEKIVAKGHIISISSNVKKVYQFKEKHPRLKNAIKIFLGTTVGGFTSGSDYGDFYTGVTASLLVEYLESRDYSVEVVMVLGGGRCTGCLSLGYPLNTKTKYGRRFIGVTVKKFDEQLDLDKLLYWTADPSALHIKMLRYMNVFHWLYGDKMTYLSSFWHGITPQDLVCPIGNFYKATDIKKGNKDLMYYFVHQVDGESDVARAVFNIVQTCENVNYNINKKALNSVA